MGKVLFNVFVTFACANLVALAVLDPHAALLVLLLIVIVLVLVGCVWISKRLWDRLFWWRDHRRIRRWIQENLTAKDIAALAQALQMSKVSMHDAVTALSAMFQSPKE